MGQLRPYPGRPTLKHPEREAILDAIHKRWERVEWWRSWVGDAFRFIAFLIYLPGMLLAAPFVLLGKSVETIWDRLDDKTFMRKLYQLDSEQSQAYSGCCSKCEHNYCDCTCGVLTGYH